MLRTETITDSRMLTKCWAAETDEWCDQPVSATDTLGLCGDHLAIFRRRSERES